MAASRPGGLRRVQSGALVAAALVLVSVAAVGGATFGGDKDALMALHLALGSPPVLSTWQGDDPCSGTWDGVASCELDNSTGTSRVTALYLFSMGLQGILPPDMGNLTHLRVLDLSLNPGISGPIPSEVGKLALLAQLNLARCLLEGPIPAELGSLSSLQFLILNDNQLSGPLPPSLGALSSLVFLDVSNNKLSGRLPMVPGVAQLHEARHLHFSGNSFEGPVATEFGGLQKVVDLLLDDNLLTGTLPESLSNMSSLQVLRLNNNTLGGGIPASYGDLTALTVLSLRNCQLSGRVPDLSRLTALMNLDLSGNTFSGPVPPSLGTSLTLLQTIDLSRNSFGGPLSTQLLNLQFLSNFAAGNNRLTGVVPDFGGLRNLSAVSLPFNQLTGALPPNLLADNTLALDLQGNPLCNGAVPSSRLGSSCRALGGNGGAGLASWAAAPFCPLLSCPAGQAPSPAEFLAPAATCLCRTPVTLGLLLQAPPFARFTGGLEALMQVTFHSEMASLGVSMDQVWVVSANETAAQQQLVVVQFFPAAGAAAWGAAHEVALASFVANHGTDMGPQFRPYSVTSIRLAPSAPSSGGRRHHGRSISTGALVAIIVGAAVVFIVLKSACMVYLWLAFRRRHRKELAASKSKTRAAAWNAGEDDLDEDLKGLKLQGVRYVPLEVLEKATDNFGNLIGEGGYGAVYKGVLESGEVVAVKRARSASQQGNRAFRSEIENLSGVRHRNLVVLLGFCKEQGEQLLVYQYMPGGNLFEWLHGSRKKEAGRSLTWPERIDIALGAARGIAYMHKEIYPPVIHRDIKSSNILLDEKLQPKVSDFGLSKLGVEDEKGGAADAQPTNVKGTLGYVDPEYFMSDRLTEKSDVYSFGVVLLELLTARRPIESYEHVVRKVITTMIHHGGLLGAIVDPSLDRCSRRGVEMLLDLALHCVKNDGDHRPPMHRVVTALEAIRACAHETDFVHEGAAALPLPPPSSSSSQPPSFGSSSTGTTATTAPGGAAPGGEERADSTGGSGSGRGLRRQSSEGGASAASQPLSSESIGGFRAAEGAAISAVLPR